MPNSTSERERERPKDIPDLLRLRVTGQQAIFRDSIALIIHVYTQSLRVNEQVKLEGEGEEEEGKQSRKMTAVAKEKNQIRSK